jgi:Ca-activated chloride channel family protein
MILFGIELVQPWALLLIALAPLGWWWSARSSGRVRFSSLRLLPAHAATWRTRLAWLPHALVALAVVGLAIALAGPRAGDERGKVRRDGIALVMAVDVSGSMRALDLSAKGQEQTRLDAVRAVFEDFVAGGDGLAGRPDDAIGLVSFAGYADTRSPLTLDHGNLITAARALDFPASRAEDGTALGDGLALAVERLRQFPAPSKVAILLTDGVETAGTLPARSAAELAAEQGIKVYTIGAGTTGTALVRVDMGFGSELRPTEVEIDEATLKDIAKRTGGAYFRATDRAALLRIYGEIDRLERTTLEQERFLAYREHYQVLVAAALIALALAALLRATLLRRIP